MSTFIDFFLNIFNGIVDILDVKLFSDMPITYFQLILGCMIIPYILNFIFAGFKEIDKNVNINYFDFAKNISNNISDKKRKEQLNLSTWGHKHDIDYRG